MGSPSSDPIPSTHHGITPLSPFPPVPALTPNTAVILGRYQVLNQLGRGAMGEVIEVYDTQSGTHYALKRLPGELALQPQLLQEIRLNFNLVRELTTAQEVPCR